MTEITHERPAVESDLLAAASNVLRDAHRALNAHQAAINRLSDDVRALESLLPAKRVELERLLAQHEGFRAMLREAFDFYREVAGSRPPSSL